MSETVKHCRVCSKQLDSDGWCVECCNKHDEQIKATFQERKAFYEREAFREQQQAKSPPTVRPQPMSTPLTQKHWLWIFGVLLGILFLYALARDSSGRERAEHIEKVMEKNKVHFEVDNKGNVRLQRDQPR
jgi:hypothetical protein